MKYVSAEFAFGYRLDQVSGEFRAKDSLKLKFLNTMTSIVGSVERPEMFSSILTHLGRRHRRFGVLSAHYTPVGTALLDTLEDILEERFEPPRVFRRPFGLGQAAKAWTSVWA